MKIEDGWLIVVIAAAGIAGFGLGNLVGQVGVMQDCANFGAFVATNGHKYECKKAAP